MPLIQKPRQEMLRNARENVRSCRAGGLGVTAVVLLELYPQETDITMEELGVTQSELDSWRAEADKIPVEDYPK